MLNAGREMAPGGNAGVGSGRKAGRSYKAQMPVWQKYPHALENAGSP